MTMTTLSVRQFGQRIQTRDYRRLLAVIRRTGAFRGSNNWVAEPFSAPPRRLVSQTRRSPEAVWQLSQRNTRLKN